MSHNNSNSLVMYERITIDPGQDMPDLEMDDLPATLQFAARKFNPPVLAAA